MPPEQQNSNPNQNPYEFIMSPQKPQRDPMNFFTGGSTLKRAVVAVVGLMVLIMLYSFVSGFLNSASNDQINRLLSVVRMESEIARVASAGNTKLSDRDVIDYAATVKASVKSTQREVLLALAQRGKEVKSKEIAVSDPNDDAVLVQGEQNGRYDQAMKQLLDKLLAEYQQRLILAYSPGTANEKQVIKSANDQVNLLLGKKQTNQ